MSSHPRPVLALAGAAGFLTRLPVGRSEAAWAAFRATPAALPAVAYPVGALAALPLALAPPPIAAGAFLAWTFALGGINHVDGLADLGDAAAVHGDREDRVAAMTDTDAGVGAALAVALAVTGLALAGLGLARRPFAAALGVAVAAEVGARLGVAALACLGTARHEGLGSQLTGPNGPRDLLAPALVATPALALARPAGAAALLAALAAAMATFAWARARLGGVSGDVFGAANELARLAGLFAGLAVLA